MIKQISICLTLLALSTSAHAQQGVGGVTQAAEDNVTGKTASVTGASAADASSGDNVTAAAAQLHGTSAYVELYNQAVRDYNSRNYPQAVKELQSVIKKAPDQVIPKQMLEQYLSQPAQLCGCPASAGSRRQTRSQRLSHPG